MVHKIKPKQVFRQYFWAQILGQGFVGVANILVTIIPPRVAAVWFTEDELSRAIGTLLSAQVIGNALGLLIPNLTIKERLQLAQQVNKDKTPLNCSQTSPRTVSYYSRRGRNARRIPARTWDHKNLHEI